MKKLLLISLMFVSLASFTQDLKGITIGSKLASERYLETTVAGIEGIIAAQTLNDGTIYQLLFLPTNRVYSSELSKLISAVENKFDIKLKKRNRSDYSGDYYLVTTKDNVSYYIDVEPNQYLSPENKIVLIITNTDLSEINDAEEQAEVSSDI